MTVSGNHHRLPRRLSSWRPRACPSHAQPIVRDGTRGVGDVVERLALEHGRRANNRAGALAGHPGGVQRGDHRVRRSVHHRDRRPGHPAGPSGADRFRRAARSRRRAPSHPRQGGHLRKPAGRRGLRQRRRRRGRRPGRVDVAVGCRQRRADHRRRRFAVDVPWRQQRRGQRHQRLAHTRRRRRQRPVPRDTLRGPSRGTGASPASPIHAR